MEIQQLSREKLSGFLMSLTPVLSSPPRDLARFCRDSSQYKDVGRSKLPLKLGDVDCAKISLRHAFTFGALISFLPAASAIAMEPNNPEDDEARARVGSLASLKVQPCLSQARRRGTVCFGARPCQ